MCGFAHPLSFKNVTDSHISTVEKFIREKTMTILAKRLSESIGEECDAVIDDEELINHFGEIYANDQESFEFRAGDIMLIKELVAHVKQIVDGNGINTGLGFFQNPKPNRKRAALATKCSIAKKSQKSSKPLVKPMEEDNLKFELIQKVTTCFEPYMNDLHAIDDSLNMNECVVVVQTEDGSKIYGDISCILCKYENRKNQKSKRVFYNTKGKTKGSWVLSNITKHLQTVHTSMAQIDENDKLKLQHGVHDSDTTRSIASHEEHYVVETDANEDLSIILVDDTDLKIKENLDKDDQELLYAQLSTQLTSVMAATLNHDDACEQMNFVLAKAQRKLTVANISGDGSCMFAALAHQLWMYKIDSKDHKQATKQLRAEVVEHILNPENYASYQHHLRDRVYSTIETTGKNVTDIEKECKFFVRHILSSSKTWGGAETLLAVSVLYSTNVFVFNENGACSKIKKVGQNHSRSVAVAFRIGLNKEGDEVYNHYDSVCEINSADLYHVARKCSKHK